VLILCVFHTFILYSLLYYFCMLPHGVINDDDKPRPPVNITWPDICSPDTPRGPVPENNCRVHQSSARVGYGACMRGEGKCPVGLPAPTTADRTEPIQVLFRAYSAQQRPAACAIIECYKNSCQCTQAQADIIFIICSKLVTARQNEVTLFTSEKATYQLCG